MIEASPLIYAPRSMIARLSPAARAAAAAAAVACALVLGLAIRLTPDPSGVGTHAALGLERCQFLDRTGLPCPTCGMTTSFAHFVRGNMAASFYVQPMGATLALATAMACWTGLYLAVTGRPALRLMQHLPLSYYLLAIMFFAVAAWGWKILIHVKGIDGW